MATCPICGGKLGLLNREKSADASICSSCHSFFFANLNIRASKTPTSTLQMLWQEITERQKTFHETDSIYDADSLFISIDEQHQLFLFGHRSGNRGRNMIFRFNEVKSYISDAEKKAVSVLRQGIISSHMETTTKYTDKENITIVFSLPTGDVTFPQQLYPAGFTHFLSTCIESQKVTAPLRNESSADELLKYKKLLDIGAITQDEYDIKKKQLLEL